MPSRNRAREAAKASKPATKQGAEAKAKNSKAKKTGKKKGKKKGKPSRSPKGIPRVLDPSAVDDAKIHYILPADATKTYICPGCNRDIPPGLGHMVAVPPDDPDLRRHWHRGCWSNRHQRL